MLPSVRRVSNHGWLWGVKPRSRNGLWGVYMYVDLQLFLGTILGTLWGQYGGIPGAAQGPGYPLSEITSVGARGVSKSLRTATITESERTSVGATCSATVPTANQAETESSFLKTWCVRRGDRERPATPTPGFKQSQTGHPRPGVHQGPKRHAPDVCGRDPIIAAIGSPACATLSDAARGPVATGGVVHPHPCSTPGPWSRFTTGRALVDVRRTPVDPPRHAPPVCTTYLPAPHPSAPPCTRGPLDGPCLVSARGRLLPHTRSTTVTKP